MKENYDLMWIEESLPLGYFDSDSREISLQSEYTDQRRQHRFERKISDRLVVYKSIDRLVYN